ncbi:hypothetical protein QQ045_008311 [Rhodiola kirilowii]
MAFVAVVLINNVVLQSQVVAYTESGKGVKATVIQNKSIQYVCWNPSGDLLASVSDDSVRVWNINVDVAGAVEHMTENKTMTLSANDDLITSLAMSTATGLVASASHDKMVKQNGSSKIYNPISGT